MSLSSARQRGPKLRRTAARQLQISKRQLAALHQDPESTAEAAGLRYVRDDRPGISRKRAGRGFYYLEPNGSKVTDKKTLARIRSLVIPPAYVDVWICPWANGHIQATGLDSRGRKQYRYHPRWREVRDETKYHRMVLFGSKLPEIRRRVDKDLAQPGLPREKVLAAIVQLLEKTMIRIGNDEYARQNKSYGLTTMRNQHVEVNGSTVEFDFRGKNGIQHHIDLTDRRLASIIKRLQDLPGQELFQYLDENDKLQTVSSADVNEYLKTISSEEFSAKDFRTWSGTILAARALQEFEKFDSQTQAKKNVVAAIKRVAARLGNTPAVCRRCYVHPAIIDNYLDGAMLQSIRQLADHELPKDLHALTSEEAAVLALLRQRLEQETMKRQPEE